MRQARKGYNDPEALCFHPGMVLKGGNDIIGGFIGDVVD